MALALPHTLFTSKHYRYFDNIKTQHKDTRRTSPTSESGGVENSDANHMPTSQGTRTIPSRHVDSPVTLNRKINITRVFLILKPYSQNLIHIHLKIILHILKKKRISCSWPWHISPFFHSFLYLNSGVPKIPACFPRFVTFFKMLYIFHNCHRVVRFMWNY